MKKKGIAYEALARLIIAVVAVAFAIWLTSSFFTATSQGEESFNELVTTIEELEPGESQTLSYTLDEEAAVIGLTSTGSRVDYQASSGDSSGPMIHLDRPSNCPIGSACLCLCESDFQEIIPEGSAESVSKSLVCGGTLSCEKFNEVNFPVDLAKEDFFSRQLAESQIEYDYTFTNGFVLTRVGYSEATFAPHFHTPQIGSRIIQLNVERKDDQIAICEEFPCFEED